VSAIRVANAPCSYGAFEITVGVLPDVPDAEHVLAAISAAGYEGTELGPPG
jgi:inosose dehydratase